ncbi:Alpha/Beta hydrolase protein [Aspergillus pseudoustus]|uniref:Alpha/Beta hydrolase protein n=1 Tax=Aspergillus pseudoustus TaxID=1810923 RepID=A0ABR4K3S3_9EURO
MISFPVVAIFAVHALGSRLASESVPGKKPQDLLAQSSRNPLQYGYGRMANEKSSLTLLYQNNLNSSDDENHVGAILMDPMWQHDIRDACEEIGESMVPFSTFLEFKEDFSKLFSYFFYSKGLAGEDARARFYVRNGVLTVTRNGEHFEHSTFPSRDVQLPVLCTQTSSVNNPNGRGSARKLVRVKSTGNTYIGFRDQKSFRFLGVPYADPPIRFTYPKPYSGKSRTVYATKYAPKCAQADGGSENCLHLNIQTPHIPKINSTNDLRPVLFWIHGGDFTDGTGSDSVTDGGNFASREDIVVVTLDYRLSTLGYLAVPGTDLRGNYGLADQVLALEWTVKNIAQFGGDPKQITIVGHSAGATSVKAFLGSPTTLGKFQGAIAMSDLGGRTPGSSAYGSYLSISDSYHSTGQRIFTEAGCTEGPIEQQVSCLKELPASILVNLPTVARHIVQDGKYITTPTLNLLERTKGTPNVRVIFGNTANEGASFATYPSTSITTELEGIAESLHITPAKAQRILDSGLFPSPNTGNLTLDAFKIAQRIATDLLTRCPTQAALVAGISSTRVFKRAYYYQTQRTITGGLDSDHNSLGAPPRTSDFPLGDPDLPYFRLHGEDIPFIFGNLEYIRDALDLHAAQLISAYFAQFIRSGNPNPHNEFLAARGYSLTLDAVNAFDKWESVKGKEGPILLLDFPSEKAGFRDIEQCEFLGWPITHYLDIVGEGEGDTE